MAIQEWSNTITVIELADDPQFSDDLDTLLDLHRLGATRFGVGYESARKILTGLPE